MNRNPLIGSALWASLSFFAFAALSHAGDLLSPVAAERLGMVESWHRQMNTVGGAASIVDLQLWVQRNTEREYIEVVRADKDGKPAASGEVLRRIAVDTKDSSGLSIGKKEAERLANLDVLKLKRRGIDATLKALLVKQVRLYLLGSDGGLSAYDAESGELLWSVRVGEPRLGYGTIGISDKFVTVVNGTTIYRVIADDRKLDNSIAPGGRPLPPVRLDNVPILGVTNSGDHVIVPNTRSGLECYTFEPVPGQPSFEMFSGQLLAKPVHFPTSSKVGWTTDRGYFYLMDAVGKPTTFFRLKTDGTANGGTTPASGDRFFVATSGGRIYGIHATRSGKVLWNRSVGEPFYTAPFIADNFVLVASSYGNLYCLKASNGDQAWAAPAPNIDSVFANTGKYLIGRSSSGLLAILTPENGQSVSVGGTVFVDRMVVNAETDRVYLVGDGGTVQCLRPAEREMPIFYRDSAAPDATAEDSAANKPAEAKAETSNPFGAAEPAASGVDPFAPAADPFGGDAAADPFGAPAGNGEAMADPFGAAAGADPFAE